MNRLARMPHSSPHVVIGAFDCVQAVTMIVFILTAAVVSSDTARSALEHTFAAGSVVVANHLWAIVTCTLLLATLCCCWSLQRVAMGSQKRPINHWSENITGRPANHREGVSFPVKGQWRLVVGKASVRPDEAHLMTGTYVGRQVWRCVSDEGTAPGRLVAATNTVRVVRVLGGVSEGAAADGGASRMQNSNDKPLQAQQGQAIDERPRTSRQADATSPNEALREVRAVAARTGWAVCVFTQIPRAGCAVLPDYADARRPLGWRLRRTHVPAPRYAVCVSRCPATSPSQAGCASTGLVIATYISNAALSKAQKAAMVTYLRNHQQAVRAFSPPTLCMRAPFLTRWGVVAGRRVGHPHRVPVHYVRHCDELRVHPASRRTLH